MRCPRGRRMNANERTQGGPPLSVIAPRQLPPCRIEAYDRRTAAVHEAGHIVVGRALGFTVYGYIFRDGEPNLEWKSWLGKTDISHEQSFVPLNDAKLRIAVAGAVAEFCWRRTEIEDLLDDIRWTEVDIMSSSDWRMSGCQPGKPNADFMQAVGTVAQYFDREKGFLWSPLVRTARELMLDARMTFAPRDSGLTQMYWASSCRRLKPNDSAQADRLPTIHESYRRSAGERHRRDHSRPLPRRSTRPTSDACCG